MEPQTTTPPATPTETSTPVVTPPQEQPQPVQPPQSKRGALIIAIVAIVVVVVAVLVYVLWPKPESAPNAATSDQLSALKRAQQNTSRRADVSRILSGVTEYQSNNQGLLPTSTGGSGDDMKFCSSQCTGAVQFKLSIYKAEGVHLVTTAPATAPDASTVYLVVRGICTADGKGLNTKSTTSQMRDLAALYAIDSGSGKTEQHCYNL